MLVVVVVHTMVNFSLKVLLCSFGWICVSVSQFHTVEVQPGEEVTLQCSNFSAFPAHISWFRMTNRLGASQISSMSSSESNVSFYNGFQSRKFNMTSNTSSLFLEIKQVDSSDSGLYFCGEHKNAKLVVYNATTLEVQEYSLQNPSNAILGCLTVFLLLVIIGLIVKIRKLHTARDERQNPQPCESVDSDAMNYTALSFHPKATFPRPGSRRELEPNVVYAATR